jgi:signal transduction histidine kinase
LQHVTEAIDKLAKGDNLDYLEVQGPEEIKSLAKSTNLLFERIQNHEKTRKQLLANLIHELGRPLGALRSGIQSLKLGAGKDPQLLDDLTTGIDAEMVRLQELLDDLAHLHDQVYGFLELNRENITPQSWLPKVLRPWQEIAAEKELDWTLEIPENLPDFKADPLRLAQIIENLVSNAIKYTPKDGSVKIIAGNDPNNIWFKVCDTGPGIPPEDENKIFEPFYRGEQKDKIIRGMGLGLSIAHDLAIAHKGEILVDSKLGQGSTFTVSIPTD